VNPACEWTKGHMEEARETFRDIDIYPTLCTRLR